VPYFDYGVELSSPPRGVIVWALLREIGRKGMEQRIKRHNDMATYIARVANENPNLELLLEPTLSICCFRYVAPGIADLDSFNRRLHRRLIHENVNMPSTTKVNGKLALRPCFIGARTNQDHARALVRDVLRIGDQMRQAM
jgi:aromatic-L-amino-acid decarboxylase